MSSFPRSLPDSRPRPRPRPEVGEAVAEVLYGMSGLILLAVITGVVIRLISEVWR